jgi:hypothetical protein
MMHMQQSCAGCIFDHKGRREDALKLDATAPPEAPELVA